MQPKDIVRQFYAAYEAGNISTALALCADDIDFLWTADATHARFAGPALGISAFRAQVEALNDRFQYRAFTPVEMIAEGDRVAVRAEIHMTQKVTGRHFIMHAADFWTVRDGKLAALVEYYDTALAAQVV